MEESKHWHGLKVVPAFSVCTQLVPLPIVKGIGSFFSIGMFNDMKDVRGVETPRDNPEHNGNWRSALLVM
jgi:hypothetical protein